MMTAASFSPENRSSYALELSHYDSMQKMRTKCNHRHNRHI
jgi:hypothetical protein